MACKPINPFVAQCGESLRAGTKAVYIISKSDVVSYTKSTNGIVNTITLKESAKFSKVDTYAKSEGITETHTVADNGIITSVAGFTASLLGYGASTGAFVKSLLGQNVVVMTQLANDTTVIIGLDGGFKLTESAGTHNATDSNRGLTFGGDIYDVVPEVDSTIIDTLI